VKPATKDKLASALILSILVALVALSLAAREAEWWQYALAAALLLLAGLAVAESRRLRPGPGDRDEVGPGGRDTPP
jgi:hypothetical protein